MKNALEKGMRSWKVAGAHMEFSENVGCCQGKKKTNSLKRVRGMEVLLEDKRRLGIPTS